MSIAHEPEDQYDAIPFSLEHYPFMKELFQSAFRSAVTEAAFQRRFETASLGEGVIGFLAIHRQTKTPAAYYGVFPVKLLWHGEIILAAQSGDTMTHEQHRKKGLFIWLAKMTFEKCREKGIALVFGLPNKNSYPGFVNRLNWVHLDDINSYDLKLKRKTIPVAKLCLKAGVFAAYIKLARLLLRKSAVNNIEAFHNSIAEYPRVFRDKAYLEYKAATNKVFIRLNGVTAWVCLADVLWIGDFDDYSQVTEATIRQLKRLATILGYNTLRFHFNEGLPQPSFLRFFTKCEKEPSCFYYIDEKLNGTNLLLTAADFDTW